MQAWSIMMLNLSWYIVTFYLLNPPKMQLLLLIPGYAVILIWLSIQNQDFVVFLNLDWTDS